MQLLALQHQHLLLEMAEISFHSIQNILFLSVLFFELGFNPDLQLVLRLQREMQLLLLRYLLGCLFLVNLGAAQLLLYVFQPYLRGAEQILSLLKSPLALRLFNLKLVEQLLLLY